MAHNGSPSLHTILEDSSDEGDMASGRGGGSCSFSPRGCNVVTPTIPIATTPSPEDTPTLLTIPMASLWTAAPQPGTGLLPEQQQAYHDEQQARACTQQVDVECRTAQHQGELVGKWAAIEAQLTELHHRKFVLKTKQAVTVDLTKARARARAVATAINHEGSPCPTFTRASQNVATMAALLHTLPTPYADGVDKVYCQLKYILGVASREQRACFSSRLRSESRAQDALRPVGKGLPWSSLWSRLHPRPPMF
jgi:hypothetical protein